MKKCSLKLVFLLTVTLILCGCSWSSFDAPDVPTQEKNELVLSNPLTSSGSLTASDGSVIAQYDASFPQFVNNSIVASRINEAFSILYEDAPADMESFFTHIKTQLGEGWESMTFDAPFHTIKLEYTLIPSDDDYVCFLSEYTIRENDSESVYPGVNMFLASTGWSLNYETLFGENTDTATTLLKSQISEWCNSNGIPTDALSKLGNKFFNGKLGISETHLFVCFDPYFFSTQYDKCITVYLPLESYKPLLIEQSYK